MKTIASHLTVACLLALSLAPAALAQKIDQKVDFSGNLASHRENAGEDRHRAMDP